MGKETLSIKQANNIINEMNNITKDCRTKIENASDQFVKDVSNVWEDKNAVDFAQKYKEAVTNIIDELSKNNQIYCERVREIANSYTKVGGITESVTAIASKLAAQINVSVIKEVFANGENGDDFGFVNPETGADQVMDAVDTLKTAINTIVNDANQKIKSINAFGNNDVKLALAQSAGTVVSIVGSGIGNIGKAAKEAIDKTAGNYRKTGSSAIGAADMTGGESMKYAPPMPGNGIGSGAGEVMKYAPPSPGNLTEIITHSGETMKYAPPGSLGK